MTIRPPADLAALIRNTRKALRLDQSTLAKKIGVSRLWLVEIEKGKPRAEIGLLLRTLAALQLTLNATTSENRPPESSQSTVDIVSPRNVFGLLSNVGEDCAGAVQFVKPERLAAVRHLLSAVAMSAV
jgi:HTH-type transcriptional regulator/antitoxin HipB